MEVGMAVIYTFIFILSRIAEVCARHWCTPFKPNSTAETPKKLWCDAGCCGSEFETHCCLAKKVFLFLCSKTFTLTTFQHAAARYRKCKAVRNEMSEYSTVEGVLLALGGFFLLLAIVVSVCYYRSHYRKTRSHTITLTPIHIIDPDMKHTSSANT